MTGPEKWRKKPVVIEAMRVSPGNQLDVASWCRGLCRYGEGIEISTLEGVMTAQLGDWIIRGVQGEFYPCKADIFEATYERVDGIDES